MFFIASKLLSLFLHPFTWVFIILLAAIFFKRKRRNLLIISVFVLYLFSNAFIFDEFNRLWEVDAIPEQALQKNYDIAIVLGGMVTYDEENNLIGFHEAIDRLMYALTMYENKRIDNILISGGSGSLMEDVLEAEILHKYLIEIGIPDKDILIEAKSRNTYENALFTKELLTKKYSNGNFLLITSASHMRRSKACFEKLDLKIDIFPVDHSSGPRKFVFDHLFIPQSHIMDAWKRLLHEWVGIIAYKIKGYC